MDKEIDRIPKNPETEIIIRIDEYMGKKGLTIREFVKSERYTGFTKAGTRIPANQFHLFKKAINSIDEKDLEEAPTQTQSYPAQSHSQQSTMPEHKPAEKKESQGKKKQTQQQDLEEVEF